MSFFFWCLFTCVYISRMSACMHICMQVCTFACTHVFLSLHNFRDIYERICVSINLYTWLNIYVHFWFLGGRCTHNNPTKIHIYIYIYIYTYMHMYMCVDIYTHIQIYTYICINIYMYTYVYTFICISYIHVYLVSNYPNQKKMLN